MERNTMARTVAEYHNLFAELMNTGNANTLVDFIIVEDGDVEEVNINDVTLVGEKSDVLHVVLSSRDNFEDKPLVELL